MIFGATVTVRNSSGKEITYSVDKADTGRGLVSWMSPLARALLKSREGDFVPLNVPGGIEKLEVVEVVYREIGFG